MKATTTGVNDVTSIFQPRKTDSSCDIKENTGKRSDQLSRETEDNMSRTE